MAPERFLGDDDKDDGRGITWAMDVFSVGCVIAELFLESPIFSLSQLYKYRKGEYDPHHGYLNRIQDKDIRELVSHMIQLEPESRYSAEEYLNFWRRKAFPEYFYSFLHQYMGLITDPSSGRAPVLPETANFGEADDRIDRVFYDFDKISYFLGYENEQIQNNAESAMNVASEGVIPVQIDITNNRHRATSVGRNPTDDGSLIFLTLVVSSLRNTSRSTARVKACDLMLAFAERITDEAKLDRVLPYIVSLLNDRAEIVKVAAIRTMTQLLSLITVVSPVNAYVFSEYVRPRLQQFISGGICKASPLVRSTYASCLAPLAHASTRILDLLQALRADGSMPTVDPEAEDGVATDLAYQNSFNIAKLDLLEHFEAHTKALLTDNDASVRRAFLGSVSSLCVFFGSSKANDVILSHLNTYLNDKNWILKCTFFDTIVGVATFVGAKSLEDFILPLMIQALSDTEEFVVAKVISSFASMAELGLFERSKTWEMVDIVARFMLHPNLWIREAAARFVSSSTLYLCVADIHCIISPLIQTYLKTSVNGYSEIEILDALKRPLPRSILRMAILWATKVETGLFWKPVQHQQSFSFRSNDQTLPIISAKEIKSSTLSRVAKTNEDEQWIKRLRDIGLNSDDDFKLLLLREYFWLIAQRHSAKDLGTELSIFNGKVELKELKVTPQTVIFENRRKRSRNGSRTASTHEREPAAIPHTITDALIDASSTISGPLPERKKLYANARKERLSRNLQSQPISLESRRGSSNLASPLPLSSRDRRSSRQLESTDTGDSGRSEGTLTPTDSVKAERAGAVKHKSSAIDLLNRRDTSKTPAETSTTSANATGKVDGPFTQESSEHTSNKGNHNIEKRDSRSTIKVVHSYNGNEPSVMRLLDNLASEKQPQDLQDFGPPVTPISGKPHSTQKSEFQDSRKFWRPEGVLVAAFGEHKGPINRVVVSPDHAFFVTASDDSTVKIWDSLRLERNLAHRSKQTYSHNDGTQVKCICFVENTHTFISGANDGSIRVVKIDYTLVGEASKYGRLRVMRNFQLPGGEHAVWLDHWKSERKSILLLATNLSRVIALDLRDTSELYSFKNPVHHGTPTCFCVDHEQSWMLLGTSHGVLNLWDLRFQLRLKSWGLSGGTPIHRIILYPFTKSLPDDGQWVCVTGGTGQNDITVWDIEKAVCREVFRAGKYNSGKDSLRAYESWKVDEERPEGMLGRFATAIDPFEGAKTNPMSSLRSLAVRVDPPEEIKLDEETKKKTGEETKIVQKGFFLTAGIDKKIRCWDCARAVASKVVSGLDAEEIQPKYTDSHPTTSLHITTESVPQEAPSAQNSAAETQERKKSGLKPSRSTIISIQQQQLLRSHLDTITDVALLESPIGMTVSVDRMGCVYVFQ